MRILPVVLLATAACAAKPKMTVPAPATSQVDSPPPAPPAPVADPVPAPPPAETMTADTPKTTVAGNSFIAPAGWSVAVHGSATVLTAPEGDSFVTITDVQAKDADEALALAWAAYNPNKHWPVNATSAMPDADGWTNGKQYSYITSPNEKRSVIANAMFANGMWTVILVDLADAVAEKRGSQLGVMFSQFYPKGHDAESFKGKQAHDLDAARLATLSQFVQSSMEQLQIPGVSVGIVQNGKIVLATGFGVRELGKPAKVDADTKYMIASNTKALTTLMLAKLVDEKKLTWETTATTLLPTFKLGDADTTSKVLVKHLICACTGLPRQDLEWLMEYAGRTPETTLATLATMQPTSKFGELFQYSNPLAAAAGFIGGHVAYPKLELGKAYDEAMRTRVFGPLGMSATTFDFAKVRTGNVAQPHGIDIDGKTAHALGEVNTSIIPVRPAGGAWSTVRDMLKYVQMELAEGKLPSGKLYVSREALLARRAPQVALDSQSTYGMGLMVHTRYGITLVNHGGDMIGFHSDMMWLPEYGVGAVILTNGDLGPVLRGAFRRKLLEVLFDGHPEADADVAAAAAARKTSREALRKLLTIPAPPDAVAKLAARYSNAALGSLVVVKNGTSLAFDFGEYKAEMAMRANPDGTTSFVTISPGIEGLEMTAGEQGGKKTLTIRDAQHEYVFVES